MADEATAIPEFNSSGDERVAAIAKLPRYKCHKEVWALKISALESTSSPNEESDGGLRMIPAEDGYAPIYLSYEYVRKHRPQVGGYYVVYRDGYNSFSPATAFEGGYTLIA